MPERRHCILWIRPRMAKYFQAEMKTVYLLGRDKPDTGKNLSVTAANVWIYNDINNKSGHFFRVSPHNFVFVYVHSIL